MLTSTDHQQAEETTHAAVAAEETEETTRAGEVAETNGTAAAAEVEGTRTEVAAIGTEVLAIGTEVLAIGTGTAEETGGEIATATPPTPDTPAETDRPTTGRLLLNDHPT